MPETDPPVGEQELLGRVSYLIRNGKCREMRRRLTLGERVIATLIQRSETATRVVAGVHGRRHALQVQVKNS
jgi:hypothetical protein